MKNTISKTMIIIILVISAASIAAATDSETGLKELEKEVESQNEVDKVREIQIIEYEGEPFYHVDVKTGNRVDAVKVYNQDREMVEKLKEPSIKALILEMLSGGKESIMRVVGMLNLP